MIEDKARERRRGLLINITGNGKGKTTAALGLSLRALGWGWRIEFLQFIKNDGDTGEKHFADAYGDNFVLTPLGAGFSWRPNASEVNDARAAADAWRLASEKILSGGSDMLVLDELNIAISRKHVSAAEVIETLKKRPPWMHVVITGRHALPEIVAASDLVSEVNEIKHPFRQGVAAQKGIEF